MASTNLFTDLLRNPDSFSLALGRESRDSDESDALTSILREVRRYCSKEVDGAAIDARGAIGQEILGAVRERGWFGLTIPDRFGGAGLSIKAATRVVTELAAHNGSLGTCVGLHSGLALYGLIHLGQPSIQEQILPETASGQRLAAFAATEPNAGSDIASMRTTLSRVDGALRLNGSKCYVTNGGLCGIVTVVAASPGLGGAKAGHTMVAVDPSWPGVSRQAEEHKLGLKGSSTLTFDFENVEIPEEYVLGEFSRGLEYAHRALTWGRTFMAAGCLGSAQAAIHQMQAYAAERVQFGRALAKFPLVQEQVASCVADTYASQTVIRLVCDLFDSNLGDIALPSTVAKVLSSEVAWDVIDRGVQIMGGAGFMEDAGMARRLRDMRVTRIFEGANDVLRMHLAAATLGWQKKDLLDLPRLLPQVPSRLADDARVFDELLQPIVEEIARIQKAYGFKLYEKQSLQSHMADAIISAYSSLAVMVRASAVARQPESVETTRELAIASYASQRCARKMRSALERMREAPYDREVAAIQAIVGA